MNASVIMYKIVARGGSTFRRVRCRFKWLTKKSKFLGLRMSVGVLRECTGATHAPRERRDPFALIAC